jgi:peptidyl-prolyl cis-trans isomerase SurA
MNEFHDGILLFEISEKKVWNRVSNDTLGLRKYYDDHKNSYLSPRGIDAKIYTLKSLNGEKSLSSAYKKYSKKPDTDKRLLDKFNKNGDTLLTIIEKTWFKGDDYEIDRLQWQAGSQQFNKDGFPSLILIYKVIEPLPLKFDIVRGELLTEYQQYLENEWVKQLKEKYSVKIDSLVFDDIKKKLNNE